MANSASPPTSNPVALSERSVDVPRTLGSPDELVPDDVPTAEPPPDDVPDPEPELLVAAGEELDDGEELGEEPGDDVDVGEACGEDVGEDPGLKVGDALGDADPPNVCVMSPVSGALSVYPWASAEPTL